MLKVARGFYNKTISLKGRTNKTVSLFVEFWWWLQRKAGYVMKVDQDKKRSCTKVLGGMSCQLDCKILQGADSCSDWMCNRRNINVEFL
jgi:hypothetical protein